MAKNLTGTAVAYNRASPADVEKHQAQGQVRRRQALGRFGPSRAERVGRAFWNLFSLGV
jgi:hypothetical protein